MDGLNNSTIIQLAPKIMLFQEDIFENVGTAFAGIFCIIYAKQLLPFQIAE